MDEESINSAKTTELSQLAKKPVLKRALTIIFITLFAVIECFHLACIQGFAYFYLSNNRFLTISIALSVLFVAITATHYALHFKRNNYKKCANKTIKTVFYFLKLFVLIVLVALLVYFSRQLGYYSDQLSACYKNLAEFDASFADSMAKQKGIYAFLSAILQFLIISLMVPDRCLFNDKKDNSMTAEIDKELNEQN